MQKRRRQRRLSQPDLFTQVSQSPTWNSLQSVVTRRVTELLAELLRNQVVAGSLAAPRKEASDE